MATKETQEGCCKVDWPGGLREGGLGHLYSIGHFSEFRKGLKNKSSLSKNPFDKLREGMIALPVRSQQWPQLWPSS